MPVARVEVVRRGRALEVREKAGGRRSSVGLLAVMAAGLAAVALSLAEGERRLTLLALAAGLGLAAIILSFRPLLVLRAAEDGALWRGDRLAAGTGELREILIEETASGRSTNYRLWAMTLAGQSELAVIDTLSEARKAAAALAAALDVPVREEIGPRLQLNIRFRR